MAGDIRLKVLYRECYHHNQPHLERWEEGEINKMSFKLSRFQHMCRIPNAGVGSTPETKRKWPELVRPLGGFVCYSFI